MNWLPKSANLEYGIVVPLSIPPAVWNVICLSLVAGVKVLFVLKYKVSNLGVVLLGSNNPKEFWEIKLSSNGGFSGDTKRFSFLKSWLNLIGL